MHDGQNLFDPRLSYTGIDWGVEEYSAWHKASQYARFLIEELMPRVNAEFRTLTETQDTFAMGSSMGGLLSYYLVKEHSDYFSACGCISTHFPISATVVAQNGGGDSDAADVTPYVLADGDTVRRDVRFFFDYGSKGLDAKYGPSHAIVRDWLLAGNE